MESFLAGMVNYCMMGTGVKECQNNKSKRYSEFYQNNLQLE